MSYDAIVIGAGHNGLVTAGTLARAGRKVLVLERRPDVGGRIATESPWPGYRVSGALHSVGRLRPRVARELGLDFDIVPHDPVCFAPQPDGRYLALWQDARRTARDLARFSPQDARRYPEYATFMAKLANFAAPILDLKPPPLDTADLSHLFDMANLGIRFRMLGKNDMIRAMRMAPMCVADFVGEWFETDALKAALAAPALWGLYCGPWSSGTGATLIYHALEGPQGVPAGGTGELAEALAKVCLQAGVELRRSAEVADIRVDHGRVRGVRLVGGESIDSQYVFSSLDPKRTFQRLMPPTTVNPAFARQIRNYCSRGVTARINLALDGLPEFACLAGMKRAEAEALLRGRIHIGPTVDFLERAFDAAKYGRYAREPMVEMVIPTLADPTLAPEGRHILSLLVQWAPYHLTEGTWDTVRDQFADDVLSSLAPYLPGLQNRILERQVVTPLDLERTLGLTEGHLHHGEHSLHQLFFSRPVPGLAQYSCEVENLYLCGAGAHPGGGITGAAGSNAAHALLDAGATAGDRARAAAGPVGKGLAMLGAGLAVGMAVRALKKGNDRHHIEEKTHGNSDTLS